MSICQDRVPNIHLANNRGHIILDGPACSGSHLYITMPKWNEDDISTLLQVQLEHDKASWQDRFNSYNLKRPDNKRTYDGVKKKWGELGEKSLDFFPEKVQERLKGVRIYLLDDSCDADFAVLPPHEKSGRENIEGPSDRGP